MSDPDKYIRIYGTDDVAVWDPISFDSYVALANGVNSMAINDAYIQYLQDTYFSGNPNYEWGMKSMASTLFHESFHNIGARHPSDDPGGWTGSPWANDVEMMEDCYNG